MNSFAEAVPYGELAMDIAEKNGDALGLANACNTLSLSYHRLERHEEGVRVAEKQLATVLPKEVRGPRPHHDRAHTCTHTDAHTHTHVRACTQRAHRDTEQCGHSQITQQPVALEAVDAAAASSASAVILVFYRFDVFVSCLRLCLCVPVWVLD